MASLVASYSKILCEFLEDLKRNVALACSFVACHLPNMLGTPAESEYIDDKRIKSIIVFRYRGEHCKTLSTQFSARYRVIGSRRNRVGVRPGTRLKPA